MNRSIVTLIVASLGLASATMAANLPAGFEQELIVSSLQDPATMAFSPDGRLFIAERVLGQLRIAVQDGQSGTWTINPQPFHTFDIPTNGSGQPEAHRSSGLRGFAFDPGFETNGYIYCFYMLDDPRHNRVVRIQASQGDPNVADPGELLLMEIPFNGSGSSGSHNGGAVVIGDDGMLYFTTGDGWNGGDNVQSLSTYTGKVFRINRDGSIPTDNPFFNEGVGDLRAIYALGLRNPFSMSKHPVSGNIYINDVAGSNKARILRLESAANYGHDGFNGIGVDTNDWSNAGTGGSNGRIVSGGVWYGTCGSFAPEYHGRYITSLWGGNGGSAGEISMFESEDNPVLNSFATDIGYADPGGQLKPMYVAIGPEGDLYYLASSYEADNGQIYKISQMDAKGAISCEAQGVPAMSNLSALVLATLVVACGIIVLRRHAPMVCR